MLIITDRLGYAAAISESGSFSATGKGITSAALEVAQAAAAWTVAVS